MVFCINIYMNMKLKAILMVVCSNIYINMKLKAILMVICSNIYMNMKLKTICVPIPFSHVSYADEHCPDINFLAVASISTDD